MDDNMKEYFFIMAHLTSLTTEAQI
jgi:hypothetical protein